MKFGHRVFLIFLVLQSLSLDAQGADLLIKIAPPGAVLTIDGVVLPWMAEPDGFRHYKVPLEAGTAFLRASGYASRAVDLSESRIIETKLERRMSGLRLRAILSCAPRPKSLAFSPDGKFLLAAPLSGTGIDVWEASSLSRRAFMSPPEPWADHQGFTEMAFLPQRREVLVSQLYDERIQVFSLDDLSWKRSLPSHGSFPKVILADPDGESFWVSTWLSKRVNRIDARTGSLLGGFRCDAIPRGLALSPDGKTIWVALFEPGAVERREAATGRLLHRFLEGGAKRHLLIDADGERLFVSDMARGKVHVFSARDDAPIAEIRVGPMPNTIVLDDADGLLFVSLRGPNNPVDYERKGPEFGRIVVVDLERMALVDGAWGGNQPTGLALSPDGSLVAFSDFLDHRVEVYRRDLPRLRRADRAAVP